MIELSIEEKARRYDEAIERAKNFIENGDERERTIAESIFAGIMEESDDERIRKVLLNDFKNNCSEYYCEGVNRDMIIAWLEKQGKNNMGISEATKQKLEDNLNKALEKETPESWNEFLEKQGDKVSAIEGFETEFERQVSGLIASTINKEYEYNQGYVKWTANALLNYAKHELEKQGKKRPVISNNALREGIAHFGITQYQIDNWLKKYVDVEKQGEQKSAPVLDIEIPFGAKDSELQEASYYIPEGFHAEIDGNRVVIKKGEQILANFAKTCKDEQKPVFEMKTTKESLGIDSDTYNKIVDKCVYGEQKPTDKVGPKFKVGDWCIDNEDGTIFQIVEVLDNTYSYKTNEGKEYSCTQNLLEYDARLWTIQDAKDGDVLEFGDHGRLVVGIVSYINKTTGKVDVNCLLENNNFKVGNYYNLDTIKPHPATKEQRDLLFSKMKEAGYEWNVGKKKLEKDEIKIKAGRNYRCTKTHIYAGLDWLEGTKYYADEDYSLVNNGCTCFCPKYSKYEHNNLFEDAECDGCVEKQCEQKNAWGEDDEKMLNDILMCGEHHCYLDAGNIDWLKSLKSRVLLQPKQEWSAEDRNRITNCIQLIGKAGVGEVKWLKSLESRILPQPKQEWNEEDDSKLKEVLYYVEYVNKTNVTFQQRDLTYLINWLKSLRPQKQDVMSVDEFRHIVGYLVQDIVANEHMPVTKMQPTNFFVEKYYNKLRSQPQWKPSDEQMEILLSEVTAWTKGCPKQKVLETLYNDLKKLRDK